MNIKTKLLSSFSLAGLLAINVSAQVVTNGSFENNSTSQIGEFGSTELGRMIQYTQNPSGWETVENVGIIKGATTHKDHAVSLSNGGSSIKQSIYFAAPGAYALTFDSFTVPRDLSNTSFLQGSSFAASIAGASSSYIEVANGAHTSRTLNFNIASAGNYALRFSDVTQRGYTGTTYLDNVQISVPEPSSAILLGLAGLGFIARRQRK